MLAEFFRDKTPARLLMLAAIVLLFVSQFFLYLNDSGGYITNAMDLEHYTQLVLTGGGVGTGWELHPHAYVILVVLGFAYLRDDIVDAAWFARFGWIATVVLVFAATVPGAYIRNAIGGSMGGIALLLAIIATVMHHMGARTAAKPASKG